MDSIQRILQGDRTIYADIIQWYSGDVLRLCYSLLWDTEESKDVFQETLLRLIQTVQAGNLRSANGSIKGFLLKTARNLCIDRLRKRVRFDSYEDEDIQHDSHLRTERTPDLVLEENNFQESFEYALSQLGDIQRIVIVLHELNQETHQEIANTLNLSVDAVKAQLSRARSKMRILLKPYWE